MIPVAPASTHTDAAEAAILAAADLRASPLMIERGIQPEGSGWQGEPGASTFRPYVVLYPSSGQVDGTVAEPTEYLLYACQANCVSADQAGAEAIADLVMAAWANQPLTIVGRQSYPGEVVVQLPATRDDSLAPPLHYSIVQVTWRTQAA